MEERSEVEINFRRGETIRIIGGEKAIRCTGKENWDKEGHKGEYFGDVHINGRSWAIVLWDEEEDPGLYKAEGLLVEELTWRPLL